MTPQEARASLKKHLIGCPDDYQDIYIRIIEEAFTKEVEERIAAWAQKEGAVIRTEIGWVDSYDSARGVKPKYEERSVAEAIRAGEHRLNNETISQ